VATEFKPWVLFEPRTPTRPGASSCQLRAAWDEPFLALLARETWRTVAIATAGITLGLVIAVPLACWRHACCRSPRCREGRMARAAGALRQAARWVLIALRSIPELVWALVFVRVVGLGPTAGVLAIALTYGGMLGKVYGEILEAATTTLGAGAAEPRQRPPAGLFLRACCRTTPPSSPATPSTAGNVRSAARWCWASWAPAAWASHGQPR
jgi:phosphonate transport system permease protein